MSATQITDINASPPRLTRKQAHPHRSLKQLASVADKIVHGIIVIEPMMPWEQHRYRDGFANNPHLSYSDTDSDDDFDTRVGGSLIQSMILSSGQNRAVSEQYMNRYPYNIIGDDTIDTRKIKLQFNPQSSDPNFPNPGPSKKAKKDRRRSEAMGAKHSQGSTPFTNISRSPASMGFHIEDDSSPPGIQHRKKIFQDLWSRKRTSAYSVGSNSSPLDISEAPGSSLLDGSEVAICCALRLYPLQYFQSRDTLLKNYFSRGFYKKSAAQKMLHIDVNKTGKLYDYLTSRNWMPIGPSASEAAKLETPSHVDWKKIELGE